MNTAESWQQELIDDTAQDLYQWLASHPAAGAEAFTLYLDEHIGNLRDMFNSERLHKCLDELAALAAQNPKSLMQAKSLQLWFSMLEQAIDLPNSPAGRAAGTVASFDGNRAAEVEALGHELDPAHDSDSADKIATQAAAPTAARESLAQATDLHSPENPKPAAAAANSHSSSQYPQDPEQLHQWLCRLAERFEAQGVFGCQQLALWLATNIQLLDQMQFPVLQTAIQQFLTYLMALAENPNDPTFCLELLELAEQPLWPQPLSEEQSLDYLALLIPKDDATGVASSTHWTLDDVSLVLADDVSPQVLDCFLQDAPQQIDELLPAIAALNDSFDLASLQAAQRISHTLKGAASLVGAKAVANISHELEALLEHSVNTRSPLSNEQRNWVECSVDCLADAIDFLLSRGEAPDADTLFAQLHPPTDSERETVTEIIIADQPQESSSHQSSASAAHAEQGEQTGSHTPAAAHERIAIDKPDYDQLLSLAEEMNITLVQTRDLQGRLRNLLVDSMRQEELLQLRRFELESQVDSRSQAGNFGANLGAGLGTGLGRATDDGSLTESQTIDPLEMDRYDDLYSSTHRFIETVADSRAYTRQMNEEFLQLESLLQQQQRHNIGLQNCLLSARQVPVSYISQRLHRCVRETCRSTGKSARLELRGETLRIDKELLDNLAYSLMHLLRNAIDHGIEMQEDRIAAGKEREGVIKLSFMTDGLKLIVECEDDGAGLSLECIRERAIERGQLNETTASLDHDQIEAIIFQSGFSTRAQATQISGRGIGLDAVRNKLIAAGGDIHLQPNLKQCGFKLELPLRRLTQHMLLVKAGSARYALPSGAIEQILARESGELRRVAGKPFLEWQSAFYPYYELDAVLHNTHNRIDIDGAAGSVINEQPLVLVKMFRGIAAVAVEQLLGAQALVRRPLGEYAGNIVGVDGVTLLGDGTPVALLDLKALLAKAAPDLASAKGYRAASAQTLSTETQLTQTPSTQTPSTQTQGASHILVVDDSLSVRNSLSELITDMGFLVSTASDGVEAVAAVQHHNPDLVLVDMEMPRMNGLDFTRWLRSESPCPNLPVVMLTSRTQSKHRQMAESAGVNRYQTKPYNDVELLDCINNLLGREAC
ncbi:response regulator [Halioxenophilus sp. WMMB6]|uniref:hybrid sensor histidine kinase/response regulator n=1 Tax=Halioxenophilus sp. WMMB6 TaxID=3073815 RepID=UPI00295F33D7|nr:response regulator [Halioxenophilus sp. WMMB6]